ncbi:MAG: hypothetical protein ABS934_12175 [Psychrobacillus sp.]
MKINSIINNKVKYIILLVIMTFLPFINFFTVTGYACSCDRPNTVKEELDFSSTVFSGTVVEIIDENKNQSIYSSADPIAVHFEVNEYWKGQNQSPITVYTVRNTESCGYEFELNQEYLVYANESNGEIQVNYCSKTTLLSLADKDLAELGKGEKPIEKVLKDSSANKGEEQISPESSTNIKTIYISLLSLVLLLLIMYVLKRIKKSL